MFQGLVDGLVGSRAFGQRLVLFALDPFGLMSELAEQAVVVVEMEFGLDGLRGGWRGA